MPSTDAASFADQQYEAVKDRIAAQVGAFRRYNYDSDDLLSVANEAFMDALLSHNRRKCNLERWIAYKVKKALQEELRTRLRHKQATVRVTDPDVWERILARGHWNGEPFSEDAKHLIELVQVCDRKGMKRKQIRRTVKEITRTAGWDDARLTNTIVEIRQAIKES